LSSAHTRALEEYGRIVGELDELDRRIQATPDDAPKAVADALTRQFEQAHERVRQARQQVERQQAIQAARRSIPPDSTDTTPQRGDGMNSMTKNWGAVARGELQAESIYRPDQGGGFLRDLYASQRGDAEAKERLWRNDQHAADLWSQTNGIDKRDMGDVGNAGGQFVPPLYLADAWVHPSISRRPLADALPKLPLPPTGTAISIPQLSSGVAVAARSSGGTVQETDGVTATITHDVNEISGLVDVDRIAVMRSDPTLDVVIGQTLKRRHDAYLDSQLISGSGTAPQHRGILNVSGINAVTYTSGTPTTSGLLSKIADAIQQVSTNRAGEVQADMIVLHGRRGAWMASNLSSSFPLFQIGALNQAAGTTAAGFVDNLLGLKVILDANVPTTLGAGTNEDRLLVVASEDYLLLEGPIFARVMEQVGSTTGAIRFDVFSHSAFLSKRYPASASVVSGTGLAAPVF
jgi:HK97 family phage major capsid protein